MTSKMWGLCMSELAQEVVVKGTDGILMLKMDIVSLFARILSISIIIFPQVHLLYLRFFGLCHQQSASELSLDLAEVNMGC